ncbi:MAG: MFS transporter [Haloarculaceae archaeon]
MAPFPSPSLPEVPAETKLVVGLVGGAEFVNHTYLVLFPPILGLLAAEFEVTLGMLGLAMGVQGVTNAAFQLPFGYLSDDYDRRLVLGLSMGISTASVFLIALAPTFELLLVGQALLGVGVAGHHPVHFPLLAEATPEHLRARAFSVRGFLGSLGFAAPPVVVTAVVGLPGLTWRHAVGLIGLFGAGYTLLTLLAFRRYVDPGTTTPEPGGAGRDRPLGDRLRAEARTVVASPAIVALALLALVASVASWSVTSYAVVLLQDGYGLGLEVANLSLTAMFVAGAVAVLGGGYLSDRFSPGPVIVSSYASVALFVGVLASLAVAPAVAVVAVVLVGGLRALGGPARSRLADVVSARADLGRNFAIVSVGTMAGSAVAPPMVGGLIEYADLRVAFLVVAGITVLAAGLALAIVRSYGDGRETAAGSTPGDD